MASIDFDIADYLHEASIFELEKELNKRLASKKKCETGTYMDVVISELKIDALSDVLKFEHFMMKFRNIPESELDEFLNKYQ